MPTSAIACTAAGLIWSAGCEPADRTSTAPSDRWVRNAAAIWDRPALWTQTNNTLGRDMDISPPSKSGDGVGDDDAVSGRCGVGKQQQHQPQPEQRRRRAGRRRTAGTEAGAMPANVSENIRPMVTAGLANEVELVNQYAAPM